MKRGLACLPAIVLAFALSSSVFGHTPTAGAVRLYPTPDYKSLPYHFGGSYPSFVTTAYNTALPTSWLTNNNSRAPRFSYSASGAGIVYYTTTTGVPQCDQLPGWIGCANNGGLNNWHIWLRNGFTYCETNGSLDGCFLAKKVILHEAMHVTLAVVNHDTQSATLTLVGPCSPSTAHCAKPSTGWDSNSWKECDQAAFQMKYGLDLITGSYGGCLDHVSGAIVGQGLELVETHTTGSTSACAGVPISASGRLATETNTSYGLLSNKNIASRVVKIDRKLHSSGTWVANWSSVTTTAVASGNNWTRSFTENPSVDTLYDYRLHFLGEAGGLASDYSSVITLQWTAC